MLITNLDMVPRFINAGRLHEVTDRLRVITVQYSTITDCLSVLQADESFVSELLQLGK